MYINISYIS